MKYAILLAAMAWAVPAMAQTPPAVPAAQVQRTSAPTRILFIGNSFTYGSHSAVRNYRAASVTDLNGLGYGGVPALFKLFTQQAGLNYAVSHELRGGATLGFHLAERRAQWERPWDVVVLQDLSTYTRETPGNPASHIRDAGAIAALLTRANPRVRIELMATWSRADLVYRPGSRWSGTPIARMAEDLRKGTDAARRASPDIDGVIPVGQAWNRAFANRVADPNPYDGIAFGQLDLWGHDQFHASTAGYYLEALVVFGRIIGRDPRSLGAQEKAADELGLSQAQARALQQIAWETLAAEG
ncbi:PEP-CTERM sorting domain-containing protein [Sphingomonas sp. HF-S4]|uniref:PEP-CTERM sorting domain-containing protein n=1 Tax=Sphingomonas agrestis TaxID=3080540 RepID=A0ABU3Y3C7_9SPHN|nr:PEP-CTERM sorting domain-containing protein [Sphingomonas sp. HF-S4]MDV3455911.1 PEP-CTERM sorting domain-containing protein [Sphingomonas sp. HF-S4]